jgi:hypothetical protein
MESASNAWEICFTSPTMAAADFGRHHSAPRHEENELASAGVAQKAPQAWLDRSLRGCV